MDRDDLGFLLAKATQRWNEQLQDRFRAAGWGAVRPSYGSILVPLFGTAGNIYVNVYDGAGNIIGTVVSGSFNTVANGGKPGLGP